MKKLLSIIVLAAFALSSNAQIKISALPTVSGTNMDSVLIPVVQESVTKKAFGYLFKSLGASYDSAFKSAVRVGDSIKYTRYNGYVISIYSPITSTDTSFLHAQIVQIRNGKQDLLTSGTNIKTINGASILGSSNIVTPLTDTSAISAQLIQLRAAVSKQTDTITAHDARIQQNTFANSQKLNNSDTTNKWVQKVYNNLGGDSLIVEKGGTRFAYKYPGGSGSVEYLLAGLGIKIDSSGRIYTVNLDTSYGKKYFPSPFTITGDTVRIDTTIVSTRVYVQNALASFSGGTWTLKNAGQYNNGLGSVAIGSQDVDAGKLSVTVTGLGTTPTATGGVVLRNTTPATSGNQQISPSLILQGRGYSTGASASDSVGYAMYTLPVQGGSATPQFLLQSVNTVGTRTTQLSLDGSGATFTGTINSNSTNTNAITGPLGLFNTTTGRFMLFFASGMNATFGQQQTGGNIQIRGNGSSTLATGNEIFGAGVTAAGGMPGGVMIGGGTIDNSALLNLTSTTKGLAIPRMTTSQRDAINLVVSSITVTNGGTGYTSTPTVTFTSPVWGEIQATVGTVTRTGNVITSVAVNVPGSYATTPTISISGGGGSGAVLTPVMTSTPATGLMIYNTTIGANQTWDGTKWVTEAARTNIVEISGTTQSATTNTIYIPHNSSLTAITLPSTANVGDLIQVVGEGSGKWRISQNASQVIVGVGGASTTSGTSGYVLASDRYCTITLRCVSTNTFVVTTSQGTISFN